MRGCRTSRCRAVDVATGIPSDYRPTFRPRRLVMPVDRWNMYDNKRAGNIARADEISKSIMRREATKRGAIQLATVPKERSAADTFRCALDNCLANGLGSIDSLLSVEFKETEDLLFETRRVLQQEMGTFVGSDARSTSATTTNLLDRDLIALGTSSERNSELAPRTNRTWELLEKTAMNSPAHGFLALRGKALIESVVLKLLYAQYPRLRSHHAQNFLAQCTSLLPMSRVATRLGMIDLFGIQLEVGLWREMNTLLDRVHTAGRMSKIHKERLEVGHVAQRRWYWQSVLRSAARKLSSFHLEMNDIRPRMEWLRDQVFQWIGALESLEGNRSAVTHIERLFASQLAHFLRRQKILDEVESLLSSDQAKAVEGLHSEVSRQRLDLQLRHLRQAFQKLVQKVKRDTDMFGTDSVHPLDEKGRQRKEMFSSQFGVHGVEGLKDDIRDVYRVEKMKLLAPPQVVHLIQPNNAFKEAQIVLRYDPLVAPSIRNAPIDVDQTVRKVVEVHETNKYNSLPGAEQLRTVEYTEVKLFAGNHCIGLGKGETDMIAINEASIHMLANYYLRKPSLSDMDPTDPSHEATVDGEHRPVGVMESPVIRKSREESEYVF